MTRKAPPVRDYMSRLPIEVDRNDTVGEAATRMAGASVRHVPVMSGFHLFGILSERDIQLAQARGGEATMNKRVESICTHDVAVVAPVAPITEAAALMRERGIGSVLVMEGDLVIGILTSRDLLRALGDVCGPKPK